MWLRVDEGSGDFLAVRYRCLYPTNHVYVSPNVLDEEWMILSSNHEQVPTQIDTKNIPLAPDM